MITESQIENALDTLFRDIKFPAEPAGLYDPLRYMIEIGGKRVRPRLALTVYSLFKDEFNEGILEPAAALEVFHSFTLIHDDIMDNASMRRSFPTVHRKWGDNTAVLSGDAMCIDSWRRICKAPASCRDEALGLFAQTSAQVCEGQQLDMDFETIQEVPMEWYMKMIGLKTAVLIACSAKMGALIAGADQRICDALYRFGYDLGLAFQIADDFLDTFGDPEIFGKKTGGDIVSNKKTWLLTRAMQKSAEMEKEGVLDAERGREALLAAMEMPVDTPEQRQEKIAKVRSIYEFIGVDEDAKYEIIRFHARAISRIESLGLGKVRREMLVRYAGKLIGRNK